MKYLSDYLEQDQTILFNELGVFFAFSNEQLEKGLENIKNSGILSDQEKITRLPGGAFCPSKNVDTFLERHEKLVENAIAQDMEENGKKAIIWREFGNYECILTGDLSNCVSALDKYPITLEEIQEQWKPYFNHCVENDYI